MLQPMLLRYEISLRLTNILNNSTVVEGNRSEYGGIHTEYTFGPFVLDDGATY